MRSAALLAVLALAACSPSPQGREGRPRPTVVSLNPCSDAVLAEVADPKQILALSHFSRDPASSSMAIVTARKFRAVSGSAEEVLALAPDIAVAGTFLPSATRAALERGGVRVVTVGIAASIDESKAQVLELARLVGNENGGILLNARIDAALARAAAPQSAQPVDALLWQAGGIVPGKNTLVSDLLTRTGFASYSARKRLGQADRLPLEEVLADPPALILAAGNAYANEDRLLRHPALTALARTRVARFDPALVWCGGPTLIRAAERLAQVRGS